MTEKITWICDGCDSEIVVSSKRGDPLKVTDWKQITITIEGFSGYPVPEDVNGERNYELCPSCQRQVSATFFPRLWARVAPATCRGL